MQQKAIGKGGKSTLQCDKKLFILFCMNAAEILKPS